MIGALHKPGTRLLADLIGAGVTLAVFELANGQIASTNGLELIIVVEAIILLLIFGLEARRNFKHRQYLWLCVSLLLVVLVLVAAFYVFAVTEALRGFNLN